MNKKRNLWWIILAAVVVIGIALTLIGIHVVKPAIEYSDAAALEESGEYRLAAEAFDALKDYKDSVERKEACFKEAHYLEAMELLENEKYEEAISAFTELGSYKDSVQQMDTAVTEQKYLTARELQSAGSYAEAVQCFEELGEHRDSALLKKQCQYTLAEQYAAEENYEEAITVLEQLADYEDSAEKLSLCITLKQQRDTYADAVSALEAGDIRTSVAKYLESKRYKVNSEIETAWRRSLAQPVDGCYTNVFAVRSDGTVAASFDEDKDFDVSDWKNVITVTTDYGNVFAMTEDGTVMHAGDIAEYEGLESEKWQGLIQIVTGPNHVLGLRPDGTVIAFGGDNGGTLSVNDWTDIVAIEATWGLSIGLKSDGTVVAVGEYAEAHSELCNWTDIVSISASQEITVGLRSDGTVVCCGDPEDNLMFSIEELGLVSEWTDIVEAKAGIADIIGRKADGTVCIIGPRSWGHVKVDHLENVAYVAAIEYGVLIVRTDGSIVLISNSPSLRKHINAVKEWGTILLP